ncbi:MAG: ATP-binding cassette domain-containing protein [Geodermatophilaceae bacterium]
MPAPEPDSPNLDSAFVEQPAVEVVGLVKRYGDVLALDGVSFAVPTGNVVALLGPNGAGKTTAVEVCEDSADRTPASCACWASIRAAMLAHCVPG